MSQQIQSRSSAQSRRGASLAVIVIAILVIGGAIYGGLAWYSSQTGKDDGKGKRTAADSVKSLLGDLEDSLKNIEKEPAKATDEIEIIKNIADADITDLTKQVASATPDVKASIVKQIAEFTPKLQPLLDKAYAVPGVKDQLEPIITKLMAGLKGLGA